MRATIVDLEIFLPIPFKSFLISNTAGVLCNMPDMILIYFIRLIFPQLQCDNPQFSLLSVLRVLQNHMS